LSNCLVAIEMASRTGASVFSVMQNLHVIGGRPSWSSSYIIAAINASGKFEPLRFRIEGEGMDKSCTAWTKDKAGNLIEGPTVSMGMAKSEGWLDRKGSKWRTMPDVMLRYRAASFFGKFNAPEILVGLQTAEEAEDIIDVSPGADGTFQQPTGSGVQDLKSVLAERVQDGATAPDAPEKNKPEVQTEQEQQQQQEQPQQQQRRGRGKGKTEQAAKNTQAQEQQQDNKETGQETGQGQDQAQEQQQEQAQQELTDVQPADQFSLAPTAVDIGAQITDCTTLDALDECRDLIRSLGKKAERDRLIKKADAKENKLRQEVDA